MIVCQNQGMYSNDYIIQWFRGAIMALCMANLDPYTTIRLGPDPNRMGHNSRGSFDTVHHACFRAIDVSSVFDRRSCHY